MAFIQPDTHIPHYQAGAWMVRGLFGANAAKSRGSALYAQKENGRPRVGTCPESAMVHGNLGLYEADEIRISHSNARALSFVCKIVDLSTYRRA